MRLSAIPRLVATLATVAVVSTVLAVPAIASAPSVSAADLDDEEVAARLCPAGAELFDTADAEDASGAYVTLYSYIVEAPELDLLTPDQLCTFAIVSTDEDGATLDGSYSLSVGADTRAGAVSGSELATQAISTTFSATTTASVSVQGTQTWVETTSASKAKKKSATKKYAVAKKKAKKAYSKAGKTKKAKRTMTKKVTAAKKKYRAAIAPKKTTHRDRYVLQADLPLDPLQ